MKKTLVLLLMIVTISVLFSCGNETANTPAESTNETLAESSDNTVKPDVKEEPIRLSDEERAKNYKVVEFELPGNAELARVDFTYAN